MDGRSGQVGRRGRGIHVWLLAALAVGAGFALGWPRGASAQAMATVQVDPSAPVTSAGPGAMTAKMKAPVAAATLPAAARLTEPAAMAAVPVAGAAGPAKSGETVKAGADDAVKTPPAGEAVAATGPAGSSATAPAVTRSAIESMPIRGGAAVQAKTPATKDGPAAGDGGMMKGLYSLVQVGGALAVVIGLIYVGRALLRKFVPGAVVGPGNGVVEILARHPLAKGQALVLVRVGSQIVVLNQGRETSQSVLVVNDAEEVANILGQLQGAKATSSQAGFNRLLANAQMDLEQNEGEGESEEGAGAVAANAPAKAVSMDEELEEMAAARRQLMDLREQVRAVRENLRA